jgi:hypothetical protein
MDSTYRNAQWQETGKAALGGRFYKLGGRVSSGSSAAWNGRFKYHIEEEQEMAFWVAVT